MEEEKAFEEGGNALPSVKMFNKLHEAKQRTAEVLDVNVDEALINMMVCFFTGQLTSSR